MREILYSCNRTKQQYFFASFLQKNLLFTFKIKKMRLLKKAPSLSSTSKENYGILVSQNWHSDQWDGSNPKPVDVKKSGYGWLINDTPEAIGEQFNFAQNKIEAEKGDYYIAYSPSIKLSNMNYPKKKDKVKIVFFKSRNPYDKVTYIVGFYAFPIIADKIYGDNDEYFEREVANSDWNGGQIKSKEKHIVLLENYVPISNTIAENKKLLTNKKLPDQGFAYLDFNNTKNIFDYLIEKNPNDTALANIYDLIVEAIK